MDAHRWKFIQHAAEYANETRRMYDATIVRGVFDSELEAATIQTVIADLDQLRAKLFEEHDRLETRIAARR